MMNVLVSAKKLHKGAEASRSQENRHVQAVQVFAHQRGSP